MNARSDRGHQMRVPAKPLRSYPFYLRPFFWNQRRKYGEVLKAALLWARVPKLFAAVAVLYGVIDRHSSPIDPALRSLVTVRVSQINSCPFCVDINSATLLKRGVSLDKVDALETWRQSNLFDSREQAVLDYAEAMTRQTYEQLTAGKHTPERCLEAAFQFLLDHEPKESILASFDVTLISRYFPEFERELTRYLSQS